MHGIYGLPLWRTVTAWVRQVIARPGADLLRDESLPLNRIPGM